MPSLLYNFALIGVSLWVLHYEFKGSCSKSTAFMTRFEDSFMTST